MNGNGSRVRQVALFFVAIIIGAAIGSALGGALALLISGWLGWG